MFNNNYKSTSTTTTTTTANNNSNNDYNQQKNTRQLTPALHIRTKTHGRAVSKITACHHPIFSPAVKPPSAP